MSLSPTTTTSLSVNATNVYHITVHQCHPCLPCHHPSMPPMFAVVESAAMMCHQVCYTLPIFIVSSPYSFCISLCCKFKVIGLFAWVSWVSYIIIKSLSSTLLSGHSSISYIATSLNGSGWDLEYCRMWLIVYIWCTIYKLMNYCWIITLFGDQPTAKKEIIRNQPSVWHDIIQHGRVTQ